MVDTTRSCIGPIQVRADCLPHTNKDNMDDYKIVGASYTCPYCANTYTATRHDNKTCPKTACKYKRTKETSLAWYYKNKRSLNRTFR